MATHKTTHPCACGCGEQCYGFLKQGHKLYQNANVSTGIIYGSETGTVYGRDSGIPDPPAVVDGPPQSGPIDRRRWRLASERPGTPESNPWIKTQCGNCVMPMWTRDPLSTWENAGLCEECLYTVVSEMHEQGRRQFQLQARTIHDPFRPR